MASDRKRDEDADSERDVNEEVTEREEEERSDDEEEESSDATPASTASETGDEEVVDDAPRNRAERRALARKQKRGTVDAAPRGKGGTVPERRIKVPPPTISGKSSADEVAPWARGIADWMSRKRTVLAAGAVAVLGVVGGALYWNWRAERRLAGAAELYHTAAQTYGAAIRAADAPPDPPNMPPRRGPTFVDATARARAALEAFRRVGQRHADAPITPLARLGEAATLYELGRYDDARRVYESLLNANLGLQQGRVLEGLGFTLEAAGQLEPALRRFEELARLDEGAWRDSATYHQARVQLRLDHRDRARDLLRGFLERVNRSRPDEAAASSSQQSVIEDARALLRDIAPEDPLARPPTTAPAGLGGPGGGSLQQVLQQLQQRRGRGGAGAGGGSGATGQ